jgi:probable F420-dependent oxidoreductase
LGGDPDAVRAIGRATEDLGYDYLLAYDHVVGAEHKDREPKLWGPYTENDPFHEPLVMFAYLAGMTERIGFATGVIIMPQRQTVLLAKQAADLDLLSGERLRLGVGVGWNWVEYDALGQEFKTRGRRANEQIEFMRRLWAEPLVDWKGEFDMVERGNLLPRPNRQIPIWIGGFSEPAWRRGAELGDGFMFAGNVDRATPGLERVDAIAAENGRDMTDYGKELVCLRPESVQAVLDDLHRWRDLGGTHFAAVSMGLGLDSTEAHLDFFAQVRAGADN